MEKITVWLCNALVALLSILGIVCYFFGPVWRIGVSYHFTSEELAGMAGDTQNIDLKDALGDEGLDAEFSLDLGVDSLFASLGSDADATVEKIVDENVDDIVAKLSGTLDHVARKVVQSVAKDVIRDKVHEQVSDFLQKNTGSQYSDEEIQNKLARAGLGDDFIAEKTDLLFQVIYSEEKTDVDGIGDIVIDIVDETYEKLKTNDEDFKDVSPLDDSQRNSIKEGVADALEEFALEDGTVDPDEILNRLLTEMLKKMNGTEAAQTNGVMPLAAQSASDDELKREFKTMIMNNLPEELSAILVWVLRGALILLFLSAAAWIYTFVKVIFKFCTASTNPTVKLKLPILLGWLPFLILFCIPALAFWIIGMTPLTQSGGMLEILSRLSASFYSIGWIALLCAGICFMISIFYMIVRKKGLGAHTGAGSVPAEEPSVEED